MAGRDRQREPETGSDEEDGFLGRWSRRKAEARAIEADQADDALEEAASAATETDTPEGADPAAFDVDSLPDIDSLGPTSDFRAFMQAGVPPELKTKALRRLWRVKSDLANLDGLIDYGEDLTGSFKVVDHLKTAYEVGRGFLKDDEAEAKDASETAEATADEQDKATVIDENPADTADGVDQAGEEADGTPAESDERRET